MTAEVHAFALLCGLAAVAFSADSSQRGPLRLAVWLLAFLTALLLVYPISWSTGWRPQWIPVIGFEPTQISMLLVIMSAVLLRYSIAWLSAMWSGLMAAIWLAVMLHGGYPVAVAIAIGAGLPLFGVLLSWHHRRFSTPTMREQARILVMLGAIFMTVVPAVAASWRFQEELRLTPASEYLIEADNSALLLLLLATTFAGLLYRLLKRRKL